MTRCLGLEVRFQHVLRSIRLRVGELKHDNSFWEWTLHQNAIIGSWDSSSSACLRYGDTDLSGGGSGGKPRTLDIWYRGGISNQRRQVLHCEGLNMAGR